MTATYKNVHEYSLRKLIVEQTPYKNIKVIHVITKAKPFSKAKKENEYEKDWYKNTKRKYNNRCKIDLCLLLFK